MRKIVLCLAVLFMTVPAMAATEVKIYCDEDGNKVTLSYESENDANLIRAFGLYITVEDANIIGVGDLDPNYRIYPGQIEIEDGEVNDYSTPYDPCDLGDANLTIEMGSLYTTDTNYMGDPNAGYGMKPGKEGTLLSFYLDASSGYTYTVSEDPNRGGVVMEDPYDEPNVTMCAPHGGCGDCPMDQSSWNPGVPDGWMGPEDVAWLINIIKNYPSYYCECEATPDCNPCLDFSSWNPGVPDGWLGPEDVAWEIGLIKDYLSYYRQCPE
jgi:hypothetical protein